MDVVEQDSYERASDWGLVLLQGIAAFILGIFLISAPAATLIVLATFIGAYWLIAGILSIVRIFTGTNKAHWVWALFAGTIGILAGLIVLRHPLYSAILGPAVLIAVLGVMGLIMGAINLVRGLTGDGAGTFFIGVFDAILGLILLGSPVVAATFLPIVAGILALIGGATMIIVSFTLREPSKRQETREQEKRAA